MLIFGWRGSAVFTLSRKLSPSAALLTAPGAGADGRSPDVMLTGRDGLAAIARQQKNPTPKR